MKYIYMMAKRRPVGPLDKRRRMTRCLACAKRRTKCEGGFPCIHCIENGKQCITQRQLGHGMVTFVDTHQGLNRPQNIIMRDKNTRFLDHFIALIENNTFTTDFSSMAVDILPLLSTSPLLHHAVLALGALHASQHVNGEGPSIVDARSSYHTSMVLLQSRLGDRDAAQREDILWATFFLGLFELFSDESGEGWARHMLYGTSKMLQLIGPRQCISPLRRKFYDLFRVLEASRTLLYNEKTILSQGCWLRFQEKLSSETTQWEPMEGIVTLMIKVSTFSLRACATIESISEPERYTSPAIALLAAEGLNLQQNIYSWNIETLRRLSHDHSNGYSSLALLYYHALLIFLSGNYDYFPYWNNIPAPVLSFTEISDRLSAILQLSKHVLVNSRIPGVMVFFPLTVAGSRARCVGQRLEVMALLDHILLKGFVVAHQVRNSLRERWAKRDE